MSETVVRVAVVANAAGLHARPSHAVVSAARDFRAEIFLHCGGRSADARSILSVMTLGAAQGAEVEIRATGDDAEAAVQALAALLADDGPV